MKNAASRIIFLQKYNLCFYFAELRVSEPGFQGEIRSKRANREQSSGENNFRKPLVMLTFRQKVKKSARVKQNGACLKVFESGFPPIALRKLSPLSVFGPSG